MWFKPGDTVRCINDGVCRGIVNAFQSVRKGNLYIVDRQTTDDNVRLIGVPGGMFTERFELYSKEDNVTKLLNKIDSCD